WIFVFLSAAALTYYLHFQINSSENLWTRLMNIRNRSVDVYWVSFILFPLIAALLWGVCRVLKREPSAADRLTFYVFLIEPLITVLDLFFPGILQWMDKRYVYLVPQIAAFTAFSCEKMPDLVRLPAFQKWDRWFILTPGLLIAGAFFYPRLSFLRYGPGAAYSSMVEDNSLLLLSSLPVILLLVWSYFRFKALQTFFSSFLRTAFFLAAVSCAIFFGFVKTIGTPPWNMNFPYDRAYAWLRDHARKNDVVLTVSPIRIYVDYMIFKTPLKCYISPQGDTVSRGPDNPDNVYRFALYTSLLAGNLKDNAIGDLREMKDKLRRLKLNYVLLDAKSPFQETVVSQLAGFADEVYRDETSLLLKVRDL
ncbi:MAG: hypothetical protein HY714_05640, partial [Candidatus Omnitrophica bacterium]|nr:hypothetical protein [Candidatus Omnitrophota bacterium]